MKIENLFQKILNKEINEEEIVKIITKNVYYKKRQDLVY